MAARIVAETTGADETERRLLEEAAKSGKNAAAVLLGHRGGIRGGKARAQKLSARRKREIARKAAAVRWKKAKEG